MSITNSGNSPDLHHGATDEIRKELLAGAQRLSSKVRNWAWWRGFSLWLGIVVTTLIVLLLTDAALRREEIGLRFLSLTVLIGVGGLAGLKFLRPVWRLAPTPVQLAKWIERSRPDLGERLSTAVQIAQTSPVDDRYGSRGFRDAVLRSWASEIHKPNWMDFLETRSSWRAVALAVLMLLLFIAGLLLRPTESRLAITRLFLPWTAHHWPQRDQLEFTNLPTVIGSGSELQLEVIDRNPPLPDNVVIHVRRADNSATETLEIPTTELEDIAIGNLPVIDEPIEVRATGGDDHKMPWQRINIVRPPNLESYQFNIEPPAYAARPTSALIGTRIQVLSRSRVEFTGVFDEPIKSVRILLVDDSAADHSQEAQRTWVSQLSKDSRTLRIADRDGQPAELTHSLTWRIELETRDGLRIELPQRWSIEVVDDAPPTVAMQTPPLNQVASNGQIALRGQAMDDLGLADISVRLQVEGSESEEAISHPIWTNPGDNVNEFLVDSRWDFAASLAAQSIVLKEAQVVSIWLEARDHLGQVGRSQTERLEIQSSENLLVRVQERQNQLLKSMRELVDAQRRNQQLTERTKQSLQDSKRVSQAEVDALAGVSQNQVALAEQLSQQKASLLHQVAEIESLLDMNRLSDSLLAEQMKAVGRDISQIASGQMQQAIADTSTAYRETLTGLSSEKEPDNALLRQLEQAGESQGEVVEALQTLADRLNRSGGIQQVQREFTEIANQQRSLIHDTEALQLEQLRSTRPEQETVRRAIADDQLALAQQLDALLKRTQELSDENPQTDSSGIVDQLSQATEAITRGEASRMMRQAAEETNASQLTSALESERKAAQVLTDALRQLDSTRPQTQSPNDLKELADDMQATGTALAELANSQSQLADQMQQANAASRAGDLSKQQASLGNQTEQQSERIEAGGQHQSVEALKTAMQEQAIAEQAAEQRQMPSAASAAKKAAAQLEKLADQFQRRAEELARQSEKQQLYQLEVALNDLLELQTPVTERLNLLAEQQTAKAATSATEIAEMEVQAKQAAVDQEVARLRLQDVLQQTGKLTTFNWTLEQTSMDMGRAVAAAQRFRIAPEAVTAANDALKKLQLANEAIKSQQDKNDSPDADQTGDEQSDAADDEQQLLPPLASLRLLRGLQNEINQQTRLLNSEPDASRKSRRLRELSDQQQALGLQLEGLLESLNNTPQPSNGN